MSIFVTTYNRKSGTSLRDARRQVRSPIIKLLTCFKAPIGEIKSRRFHQTVQYLKNLTLLRIRFYDNTFRSIFLHFSAIYLFFLQCFCPARAEKQCTIKVPRYLPFHFSVRISSQPFQKRPHIPSHPILIATTKSTTIPIRHLKYFIEHALLIPPVLPLARFTIMRLDKP